MERSTLFRPVLEPQANNAIVLLGLMLLDHAKGRGRDKAVYHCIRMTLGQYLDALETLAFPGEPALGQDFRCWREPFRKAYDPSAPLADVLADLLRQYIHGWKRLDCLDHVLCCMEGLSRYWERENTADLDPVEHYFDLALSYSWDAPDPAGEETKARDVREQIFLPNRDYSLPALEKWVEQAPAPEFRALLERFISERWLSDAATEVNEAVSSLFMLWVGPYPWLKKRPQ